MWCLAFQSPEMWRHWGWRGPRNAPIHEVHHLPHFNLQRSLQAKAQRFHRTFHGAPNPSIPWAPSRSVDKWSDPSRPSTWPLQMAISGVMGPPTTFNWWLLFFEQFQGSPKVSCEMRLGTMLCLWLLVFTHEPSIWSCKCFCNCCTKPPLKNSLLKYPFFQASYCWTAQEIRSPAAFLVGSSCHYLEAFGYIPDGSVFQPKKW